MGLGNGTYIRPIPIRGWGIDSVTVWFCYPNFSDLPPALLGMISSRSRLQTLSSISFTKNIVNQT